MDVGEDACVALVPFTSAIPHRVTDTNPLPTHHRKSPTKSGKQKTRKENIMAETKHYLYRIQPTRSAMLTEGLTAEERAIMTEHFSYLQRLTEQGVMILVGRTQTTGEDSMGIAIFNASSDEEARAIMNNDPAVKQHVMSAKIFPYRIALLSEANAHMPPDE